MAPVTTHAAGRRALERAHVRADFIVHVHVHMRAHPGR